MKPSRTQASRTISQKTKRPSGLEIVNKHPDFEYSFRLRKEVEEGGGQDRYGYEPVTAANTSGEARAITFAPGMKSKKAPGAILLQDTMLCKRPKQVAAYFKSLEDEAYNSHMEMIKNSAQRAQVRLRQVDGSATVTDQTSGIDFTQRVGPNMEESANG
jgi:hypothetical protein